MISCNKNEIVQAISKIEKNIPDKDVFDETLFQDFFDTEVTMDFTRKDLKRMNVKKTRFITCSFEAAAGTGSKFIRTLFKGGDFSGSNFQDCFFDKCTFIGNTIIKNANMSHGMFIDCTFKNIVICRSTFFDCYFENCTFQSCQIYSITAENSNFNNCFMSDIDLAHLNIEFIQVNNMRLNNVILPPYQIAFIIGGPVALKNTTQHIDIYTDRGTISAKEFCNLYEDFVLYYYDKREYFALANLLIGLERRAEAYEYIRNGIQECCDYYDFRMVKHFCRLACYSNIFEPLELKDLYHLITQKSYDNNWDANVFHAYMLQIGSIRELLLNSTSGNAQRVEILIRTDIDKDDLPTVNMLYNEINNRIRDNCSDNHIDYIELRHNSPYELYVTCIDALPQIVALLSSIYAILSIGNKFVDLYKNVAETRRVCQENKLYAQKKESLALDIELKKMELEKKQKNQEQKRMPSIYTIKEIEHTIKCDSIDVAKTIAPELLHFKYAKAPEP